MCIHGRVWWCAQCGGTTYCCAVHGVHKRCEWGQRKLLAMLICSTRVACAVEVNAVKYCLSKHLMVSKKPSKKGKEKHYSMPCGRIITKKGDCLFQLQTSSFAHLFLHSPISSGWEIGWKINETQDRKTSEPQQQETDVVIAQSRAGPELFSFIQSPYNRTMTTFP